MGFGVIWYMSSIGGICPLLEYGLLAVRGVSLMSLAPTALVDNYKESCDCEKHLQPLFIHHMLFMHIFIRRLKHKYLWLYTYHHLGTLATNQNHNTFDLGHIHSNIHIQYLSGWGNLCYWCNEQTPYSYTPRSPAYALLLWKQKHLAQRYNRCGISYKQWQCGQPR